MQKTKTIPNHIAIIMDGNGRWAAARGLPRALGHRAGVNAVVRIVEACCELGVRALTLYAFSWENWERPTREIRNLMRLLDEFVRREVSRMHAESIRLRAIGRMDAFPDKIVGNLRRVIAETARYDRLSLTLALSYGGRQEIVDAARALARLVQQGRLSPEDIDEARFSQSLYAADLSDPDLVIRTSGEQRLSNFLLWQASYAEMYVTPRLWPDFTKEDLLEAIAEYERRERRFGRREEVRSSNGAAASRRSGKQGRLVREFRATPLSRSVRALVAGGFRP